MVVEGLFMQRCQTGKPACFVCLSSSESRDQSLVGSIDRCCRHAISTARRVYLADTGTIYREEAALLITSFIEELFYLL